MPEYIERDKILKKFYGAVNFIQDHCTPGLEKAICMLCEEPPAEVAPVRHGRWVIRGGRFRCSVCDAKALWNCDGGIGGWSHEYTQAKSDRCPNCGAKMDLKEGTP